MKEFKSFQKTEATWASLDADKRGLLFKRFLKRIKPSDPAASLTSDGLRAVKAPKKGSGKKPGKKTARGQTGPGLIPNDYVKFYAA